MSITYCIGFLLGQLLALVIVCGASALETKWHNYKIEKECQKNREKAHKEKENKNDY